jgi:DegT/DnrJ/EryC1/StrS aminotransferase family
MPAFTPYISKDFLIEGSSVPLINAALAWEHIDGRMRTEVRKAQKSEVVIRKVAPTPSELADFTQFCLNPDDLPPTFTERHHFYVAELQGKMVAGILLVTIGSKLFMLCHASLPEAKLQGIPSLLIWHMIETYSGKQWTHLDIGASYRPSLQKFFTGWRNSSYPMIMRPPELHPSIALTPFDTAAFCVPTAAESQTKARALLQEKFKKPFTFFPRAMYGIYTLMRYLELQKQLSNQDNVWITTTTDTHYVSSCVYSAIEQVCPVSRELTNQTKAIFAIHEFGFPHAKLTELRRIADERKIPLIEDCAYAWDTDGVGTTGDYCIYSLTKKFPVQFGGYVTGLELTHKELWSYGTSDAGKQDYTESRLFHWLQETNNRELRCRNYTQYQEIFGAHRAYFQLSAGVDPGAFILRVESEEWMEVVSGFVRRFGTECGNYWKNSAIILPVHQRMTEDHVRYVAGSVLAMEREGCGVANYPGKTAK